jgi:hypothetical protein
MVRKLRTFVTVQAGRLYTTRCNFAITMHIHVVSHNGSLTFEAYQFFALDLVAAIRVSMQMSSYAIGNNELIRL